MQSVKQAISAYGAASARRNARDREADVFRLINGRLAAARAGDGAARARALADNTRLWLTVSDLVRDPANKLPVDVRVQLASVGAAVQREASRAAPDFAFLIAVNENVANGLAGAPGS